MALPTPAENTDAHKHQGVLVEHATTSAMEAPSLSTNRSLTVIEAETIRYHLTNARSENTRLAYERQWRLFTRWCEREGFTPFPAQVSTVILYLTHLGDENFKLSKIQQALSAIKALHSDNIERLRGGNSLHMASGAPHALTRDAISACVQRCATRAGLAEATQSISSHSLRHTFITTGFSRQIDAATIAKSSRHKTMSVLMGYDQTSRRDASLSVKLWA